MAIQETKIQFVSIDDQEGEGVLYMGVMCGVLTTDGETWTGKRDGATVATGKDKMKVATELVETMEIQ